MSLSPVDLAMELQEIRFDSATVSGNLDHCQLLAFEEARVFESDVVESLVETWSLPVWDTVVVAQEHSPQTAKNQILSAYWRGQEKVPI